MMPDPRSYGQIAYEAYCTVSRGKSLVSGDALPEWEHLRRDIQEAWEKSTKVVIAIYNQNKGAA